MSAMKELYKKVAADSALQAKADKILETAVNDPDGLGKRLVEFAKEQGYDITVEEIHEFFVPADGPLSDEDLDSVAGGKFVWPPRVNPPGPGGPAVGDPVISAYPMCSPEQRMPIPF